jgi:hypothetical protein
MTFGAFRSIKSLERFDKLKNKRRKAPFQGQTPEIETPDLLINNMKLNDFEEVGEL